MAPTKSTRKAYKMIATARRLVNFIPLAIACAIAQLPTLLAVEPAKDNSPSFASPDAAFKAFGKTFLAKDYQAAWNCLTPNYQDYQAVEAFFALGMKGKEEREVAHKYLKPRSEWPKEPLTDPVKQRTLIASMIADKAGVFAEHQKLEAEAEHPIDWNEPLRNVVIVQDRAHGVVRRYDVAYIGRPGKTEVVEKTFYDEKIYFQKSATGWLVDLPTAAELKKDAAESEAKLRIPTEE